jgi:hypothetical protein
MISCEYIAVGADKGPRSKGSQAIAASIEWKGHTASTRELDREPSVYLGDDAHDGRPGNIYRSHHRVLDIAPWHAIGLRCRPSQGHQQEHRPTDEAEHNNEQRR